MFPSPTEYPIIDKKNCIFPDQAALSGSCSMAPLPLEMIDPLGPWRTIVTPCLPPPSGPFRVLSGASSWPFLVISGVLPDMFSRCWCWVNLWWNVWRSQNGYHGWPSIIYPRCVRVKSNQCVHTGLLRADWQRLWENQYAACARRGILDLMAGASMESSWTKLFRRRWSRIDWIGISVLGYSGRTGTFTRPNWATGKYLVWRVRKEGSSSNESWL